MADTRNITQGSIPKQLLSFFFPILLGTLFQQLYNIADTVIVGRFVGTSALAAVGSTGALLSMVNGLFIGMGSGATVILSQYYGARDMDAAGRTLHTGVSLAVVLGSVMTILGVAFAPWALRLMKTPDSCIAEASAYIRIIFAGAVGSMVYNMGAGILRAMGDSRRPLLFLIISCFLNIILDLFLVMRLKMGVVGAALATVISQFLSGLLLLLILSRLEEIPLRFFRLRMDSRLLKRILAIGVPAGLQLVTFDFSNILIQSGINSFGDAVMAAYTAYSRTDSLTWMISGAFGVSVTTFVGQNFGAGRYDRIRRSVRVSLMMSVTLVGTMSVFMLLFRQRILGIYTTDAEVIAIGAYIMTIITPFNAVFMPVEVFAGTFRGAGNSLLPTLITGSCVCVFRIVWLLTIVYRNHQVKMLALCYPISWILAAVVFTAVYLQGGWLRRQIRLSGMGEEKL